MQLHYHLSGIHTLVQATYPQIHTGEKKQAIYNLLAAYIHTVPLEELLASVERAQRDAQLTYVVIYGAARSYCLAEPNGSKDRTCGRLRLKEQLAQTLAAYVTSILVEPRGRLDTAKATEPPLRQIIEVLEQVVCTHDAGKLAISVLEIYKDGYREERIRSDEILCSQADADSLSVLVKLPTSLHKHLCAAGRKEKKCRSKFIEPAVASHLI